MSTISNCFWLISPRIVILTYIFPNAGHSHEAKHQFWQCTVVRIWFWKNIWEAAFDFEWAVRSISTLVVTFPPIERPINLWRVLHHPSGPQLVIRTLKQLPFIQSREKGEETLLRDTKHWNAAIWSTKSDSYWSFIKYSKKKRRIRQIWTNLIQANPYDICHSHTQGIFLGGRPS